MVPYDSGKLIVTVRCASSSFPAVKVLRFVRDGSLFRKFIRHSCSHCTTIRPDFSSANLEFKRGDRSYILEPGPVRTLSSFRTRSSSSFSKICYNAKPHLVENPPISTSKYNLCQLISVLVTLAYLNQHSVSKR